MWQLLLPSSTHFLHPDKVYTFGRSTSRSTDTFFALESTSISRNHLSVTVKRGIEYAPSPLVIVDLGSRFGSKIDGKPLQGMTEVTTTAFKLTMGSFTAELRWLPRNICFSTGESGEADKVMWSHAKSVFDPLDIRLSSVVDESTTHFMRGGKSTSRFCQALVMGIPIVSTRLIDAISASNLYSGEWPDDSLFLQDEAWAPNPGRKSCLSGQRFYCTAQDQFENLKRAVEGAGGAISTIEGDGILLTPTPCDNDCHASFDELLAAIVEVRQVRASSGVQARRPARPQRAQFLGHMMATDTLTPTPSISEDKTAQPETISGAHKGTFETSTDAHGSLPPTQRQRPQRHKMLDHLVGTPELVPESLKRPAESELGSSKKLKADLKRDSPPTSHTTAEQIPKRPRLDENPSPESSLDASIGCMAIVEASLELKSKPLHAQSVDKSGKYAGRANFKAFRKTNKLEAGAKPKLVLGEWGDKFVQPVQQQEPDQPDQVLLPEVFSDEEEEEEQNEFSFQFS